jgi:hypothetical protein
MSDGNGIPNTTETRARLVGLESLDRVLGQQRQLREQTPPEPTPSRSMRVEAGLAALEEAEREREGLRSALAQCESDLRGVRAELDMVNLAHSRAMGEMDRHQSERDAAVTRLAAVEAVYDAVLTIIQRHRAATPEDSGAIPKER